MKPEHQNIPTNVCRALSELAESGSPAQRSFMQQVAERVREPNGGITNVGDLEALGVDRQDAVSFLKKLEDLGCGKFLAGRRGRESRIEWGAYGAIPVAKAYLSDPSEFPPRHDYVASPPTDGLEAAGTQDDTEFYDHVFLLRPGLKTIVHLPLDLTKEEANRLAEFIRTIPF